MKMRMKQIVLLALMVSLGSGQTVLSQYAQAKVFTLDGFILEGENLRLSPTSATIEIGGTDQLIPLENVFQVMAKKGLGKKYGKTCGVIALAVGGLSVLTPDNGSDDETQLSEDDEDENDPFSSVVGAVMVSGVSYGIGYVIGLAMDDWQVVYLKRQ